jgi:hypothetical protein
MGMNQPTDLPGPTRLDEIAAVTAEYAKYSRSAYGLAFVALGIAVLATMALDVVADSAWARFAYLLLPTAWLLLLAAARAYYQRQGKVVESAQRIPGRGWILGFVYFLSAVAAFSLVAGGLEPYREDWRLGFGALLAVFSVVAVPVLMAELARGWRDALVTMNLLSVSLFVPHMAQASLRITAGGQLQRLPSFPLSGMRAAILALLAFLAVLTVTGGIRQHARYRALERRLAALQAKAS